MDDEEYEAQRQANIAANFALLQSLGLNKPVKVKAAQKRVVKPVRIAPSPRQLRSASISSTPSNSASPYKSPYKYSHTRKIEEGENKSLPIPRRSERAWKPNRLYVEASPQDRKKRARSSEEFVVSDRDGSLDDDEAYSITKVKSYRLQSGYEPLRNAQRLGRRTQDPKQFGHIPGIPVGHWWSTRMDCSTDAVHAPPVSGICGSVETGCYSLALSGGYADDIDLGEKFTYTGSGGKKLSGVVNGKRLNLRTAPQTFNQSFKDSFNAALLTSSKTGKPIRVIRGYKLDSQWAPLEGYLYCGLYVCTRAWLGDGLSNFKVCKYAFERLPNQDPLPIPDRSITSDELDENSDGNDKESEEAMQSNDGTAKKSKPLRGTPKEWIIEVVIPSESKPSPYQSRRYVTS